MSRFFDKIKYEEMQRGCLSVMSVQKKLKWLKIGRNSANASWREDRGIDIDEFDSYEVLIHTSHVTSFM